MTSPRSPDNSAIQLGMTSAAISGDAGALYRIAAGLMDEGVPFDSLLFDHLLPAERAVGDRWQQGDYLISEEHAATAAIETVVSLLVGMFDQPREGSHIVIAAVEGDEHSLPGRAISAHLLYSGYRTTFLGANVLASDLQEFLEAARPDVLVLSCTMSSQLVGAHSSVTAAAKAGVPVVVGGRGFGSDDGRARAIGADAWSATIAGVMDRVEELLQTGGQSAAVPIPEDLAELISAEVAVVSDAHRRLAGQIDSGADRRWMDELTILMGAVQGAMLTHDDDVLAETLRWQESTLQRHGYRSEVVAESLLGAMRDFTPAAAAVMERVHRIS